MRRVLIIGCGDIARRAAKHLHRSHRLYGLVRAMDDRQLLHALEIVPVPGDLDQLQSLARLAGLAHDVLHFAPPQSEGVRDLRTARVLAALTKCRILPQRLLYISTSGVYGDCGGGHAAETRAARPCSARATRRLDAETRIRAWGARNRVSVSVLRVPGIYAPERLPLARLRAGTPVLNKDADPYSNHIHAEDLARIAVLALARGRPGRVYNVCDDSNLKMGDYFDLVADNFGLPRPPRISWKQAQAEIPENLRSFMQESRRMVNTRMKRELGARLQYPDVAAGLQGLK